MATTRETITRFDKPLSIKVFTPGQKVEHNGKPATVVRMVREAVSKSLTGHVVLTDRFGIHWESWSNHCHD